MTFQIQGMSGRRMLRAVEQAESDSAALVDLAKGRMREKLPALRQALTGREQPHQRLLVCELLDHIDDLEQAIHRVEVGPADCLVEQEHSVQLLLTLPATGPVTAAAILAEIDPK